MFLGRTFTKFVQIVVFFAFLDFWWIFLVFCQKNFKDLLLWNYKACGHQILPGCSLGWLLPSLFKLLWFLHFWIFDEFFQFFVKKIFKDLLLRNYEASGHQILPECSLGGPLPSLFKLWCFLHFWLTWVSLCNREPSVVRPFVRASVRPSVNIGGTFRHFWSQNLLVW